MRLRPRQTTEKYKSFRLRPDALFLSRTLQTLFNKFTKKGKKALARRHIERALQRLRYTFRGQRLRVALLETLHRLRTQFKMTYRRKGRKMEPVPTVLRRNKRDVLNIQLLANSVRTNTSQVFSTRILEELRPLAFRQRSSPLLRRRSSAMYALYEQRANLYLRWK